MATADSKSSVSARARQKIELGLPKEKALASEPASNGESDQEDDTDKKQSSSSDLIIEDEV